MANLKIERQEMPNQDANERKSNFKEVALGYSEELALNEASRCLNCKTKPCVNGCPVNIDIPSFIEKITQKDYLGAYKIISKSSSLPAVCGRVCPQECQCEKECVRGIKSQSVAIGRLERFVADYVNDNFKFECEKIEKNGKKVAVIGSGPSSLACSGDLIKLGYEVTIFEALHEVGGVLTYGIPEFRLPKDIVKREIDNLKNQGVKIVTNTVIGKSITIDELKKEFDAIYVGSGAGLPRFMNISGENLCGVYSANEYLTRINLMKAYKKNSSTPLFKSKIVAVVGGGNVAMDACRCAVRMGAEKVYVIYRRSLSELPARKEEVEHAMEEGVEFLFLTNPIKINGDDNGFVKSITCVKMELGEADERGRRRPQVVENSQFDIELDTVIMAIGTSPNPLIKNTTDGLEADKRGCIVVDDSGKTSLSGVYAGGDAVTGSATVILAMGAGKLACKSIDEFLSK